MTKGEARGYTNFWLVARQIGSGDSVNQGSPARHADRIQAPVLMFHGDHDLNVGVAQSKAMDAALRKAGKRSTLVLFPGLDHQLDDSEARTRLLEQSDAFLRTELHLLR
jgi:dipeptidyl aminopeptidase/acylaminoacyl peptidase